MLFLVLYKISSRMHAVFVLPFQFSSSAFPEKDTNFLKEEFYSIIFSRGRIKVSRDLSWRNNIKKMNTLYYNHF